MIARFRLLLPFKILVELGHTHLAHSFEKDGYTITIYPPYITVDDANDLDSISKGIPHFKIRELLTPVALPQSQNLEINGIPAFEANLLQIDFKKDGDFNRSGPNPTTDPTQEFIFGVVNAFLLKYRGVTKGILTKEIPVGGSAWGIQYLNDDEEPFEETEGLIRGAYSGRVNFKTSALTTEAWEKIFTLPADYEMYAWEQLILDAEAALPENSTIILAFSALETMISYVFMVMVPKSDIPEDVWKWIKLPGGEPKRAPSIAEQFDTLLRLVAGKSLKSEAELWKRFTELKKARNEYIHNGRAIVNGNPAKESDILNLLVCAKEIINWLEDILPLDHQRIKLSKETQVSFTITLQENPAQIPNE